MLKIKKKHSVCNWRNRKINEHIARKRNTQRGEIIVSSYCHIDRKSQCDIIDSVVHRCSVAIRQVQRSRRDASALGVNTGDSQHSTSVCGHGRTTGNSTCIMTRLQPCTAVRELCAMHRCDRANRGKATRAAKYINASFTLESGPFVQDLNIFALFQRYYK